MSWSNELFRLYGNARKALQNDGLVVLGDGNAEHIMRRQGVREIVAHITGWYADPTQFAVVSTTRRDDGRLEVWRGDDFVRQFGGKSAHIFLADRELADLPVHHVRIGTFADDALNRDITNVHTLMGGYDATIDITRHLSDGRIVARHDHAVRLSDALWANGFAIKGFTRASRQSVRDSVPESSQ